MESDLLPKTPLWCLHADSIDPWSVDRVTELLLTRVSYHSSSPLNDKNLIITKITEAFKRRV